MGFWDVMYSVGDRLKGITPYLSKAKRAGGAVYNCTSAAVTKIDRVVRVNGIQKLPQYLPDDETRAQIVLFTTKLAKNTGSYVVREGFKHHIPGATRATKLISATMHEVKHHKNGLKAMQARMDRLEEDLKKLTSPPEISSQNWNLSSNHAGGGGTENIKDMINMFMMTEFVGNHMFLDLMVPKLSRMKKKEVAKGLKYYQMVIG